MYRGLYKLIGFTLIKITIPTQSLTTRAIRVRGRIGRPKKLVTTKTLAEKIKEALESKGHNAMYVSTTKGGMKILFEGHHFKFIFRRGDCSIFQCCYKENNEQCQSRVVVSRSRVHPLDGEHNHFNQALDKSVTSVMFEATPDDFLSKKEEKALETDRFAENIIELSEAGEIDVDESIFTIKDISDELKEKQSDRAAADVLREKIKRRLQKALLGKKK